MDAIYCLPCYLFSKKPIGRPGSNAFISTGFNNWKNVKDGMNFPLIRHVGKDPNSPYKIAVKRCKDLKNYSRHIDKLIEKQTSKELENNQLWLKTSIECARWLAFQACAFKGHDESLDSKNREIGDAKFCILVDEARDESKREQMTIILRFVDKNCFIKERFFHVVHVRDTTMLTLKNEICAVLSRYNLHIENIRGQGYDGASNMRGEWNGLQVLFLKERPYAYYVHCMAHRLQLALVTASREVKVVHQLFDHLTDIINIIVGSSKHNDELQYVQGEQIENMIVSNEIETGRGANQIGTLQRAGDTRWGSHFQSICSLIKMFDATCEVINTISEEGVNYKQRDDAEGAYQVLTSFEFVLVLHMMKEIMRITNILCQALQQHSQDLLNVMHLVSTTKSLIQKLRDDRWEPLLDIITSFCGQHEIDIPDLNARYTKARGRYRHQDEVLTTIEHHLRINIFTVVIDFQLQELNSRFCELTTNLLTLSSALNPKDAFRSFKIGGICNLAKNYYPQDFTEQEICLLKHQLQHYELDVTNHPDFQNMGTISKLCRGLEILGKSKFYHLIDKLIRLVLTLPVSIATTEQAFSTMKLLKTRLRNRMKDELLYRKGNCWEFHHGNDYG
ncbi:uncharacterized protein LOC126703892 [Quercus robur]|uniref:uncharacterized protein LOC126703892 n=1 Tax=Quercus robur TaxID=38942 RepID=UPI0021635506|nr:uncharacterized protein LOC126703892 [Quercus robur]